MDPARWSEKAADSNIKGRFEEMLGRAAYRLAAQPRLRQLMFNALRLDRASVRPLQRMDEVRFLSYAFGNAGRSHAQIMQDLWVCHELGEARNGYFVEFGATDGRTNSNTALLERELGWTGLLAEPNPVWHEALARNRMCAIDRRCVAHRGGETVEFLAVDEPELGTIAAYAAADHFRTVRQQAPSISVETVSLNDLLIAHKAPETIDYMSVDTEGSEFDILSGFDFDRWRVRLFSIEHNNTPNERLLDDLLARRGYQRVFPEFSQWDGWYRLADTGA